MNPAHSFDQKATLCQGECCLLSFSSLSSSSPDAQKNPILPQHAHVPARLALGAVRGALQFGVQGVLRGKAECGVSGRVIEWHCIIQLNINIPIQEKEERRSSMKTTFIGMLSAAVLLAAMILPAFATDPAGQVRHMVVFKYKKTATDEQIRRVTDAFRGLKEKIPGIVSFEQGANISTEKKDQGFSHVYLLTFEDVKARDAYLPHPEHKKFGDLLGSLGVLEDVFVVDFSPAK
jgi:hypothetical protein